MGTIYFVRHGETWWNTENRICGSTDIGLTPEGIRQARECAGAVLRLNAGIDRILSSPLSRAADTARPIAQALGVPLIIEERLREQNFGIFEGTPRDSAQFREAKMRFLWNYETGESMMQVSHRIYSLLDEITSDPDRTVLLAAHNGIARHVESYFRSMTNEEFAAFGIRNCEIRRYDF